MTQKENTEYGKRVWAGDPKTVAEARAKYYNNPVKNLIPFAVALYSFRWNKKFARELLELRTELLEYAKGYFDPRSADSHSLQKSADTLDVLSTYFEWMSRHKALSAMERYKLYRAAEALCEYGISHAKSSSDTLNDNHSWCLLKLTRARLLISTSKYKDAQMHLADVARRAHLIKDANQRARVYRKLGMLLRENHHFHAGFNWGIKACLVPNVPLAVRVKSAVALLGVDR